MYLKKKQKLEGEVRMRTQKAIFSVLTIMFGSIGLTNIVSTDITLPIMFRSEERRVGKECRSRWSPYH